MVPSTDRALALASRLREQKLEAEADEIVTLCADIIEAKAQVKVFEGDLALMRDRANADLMSGAAMALIRDMLKQQKVPEAAFIDDNVANAIVQRNILMLAIINAMKLIQPNTPGANDILLIFKQGFEKAKFHPEDIADEEGQADRSAPPQEQAGAAGGIRVTG